MGSVVLSIDAELGWGHHDFDTPPSNRVEAGRTGWSRLVALLDEFEVPATWAIVGHLFLEECDGRHADHPSPSGWFDRERKQWRSRPDLRFGQELIEAVRAASVDHEIGSHSFTHVVFDERATSRNLARAEIEESLDAAKNFGLDLQSFVFPRNVVGHRDLLAEYGFQCYRGQSPINRDNSFMPRRLRRLLRGVRPNDESLLVEPTMDGYGLVNVPASMFLYSFEGQLRDILAPVIGDLMVRQAKRGIDLAARRDGLFHVWLHPNNLHRAYTVVRLRRILAYLAERRDAGDITIETMDEVADRVRSADTLEAGSNTSNGQ